MNRITDLLGVVLCGGQSRRMGRDKGLMTTDGIPWALRMGGRLGPLGVPVIYSINNRQYAAYSLLIPHEELVIDDLGLSGPMEGLLTVHARYPDRDLLLLACDMQDLDERTLSGLIDRYLSDGEGGAACYVYRDAGYLQPMGAIYTREVLVPAYALAKMGRLPDLRLRSLLAGERVRILEAQNGRAFRNYNTL